MSEYITLNKPIKVNSDYDVIVVGGGPAGCTAAVASAREGKRTLLVEQCQSLGGMGTSGLVPAWCPFSNKVDIVYQGLALRVMESVKKTMPHVPKDQVDWVPIDPETLKTVYDSLVSEAGADVLFGTFMSDALVDGSGNVSSVLLSNKEGLTAYKAKVYIDCTGDGDLAAWAGAPYEKGNDEGVLQSSTMCFVVSNVDSFAYQFGRRLHSSNPESPMHQIHASDKYPLVQDSHMCSNFIGPGTVGFNAGHLYDVDSTDPRGMGKDIMRGRQLARQIKDGLTEFFPAAFGNSFLAQTGALLGIRETRRIMGDYVITRDDYVARRSFDDEICRNSYYLDVHRTKKQIEEDTRRTGLTQRETARMNALHYNPGESHGVPYRALIPRKLNNVLVAGRCVSSERSVNGSLRVMPTCLAMGEGAGVAAAMAADAGGLTRNVNTDTLRRRLRELGAYLP